MYRYAWKCIVTQHGPICFFSILIHLCLGGYLTECGDDGKSVPSKYFDVKVLREGIGCNLSHLPKWLNVEKNYRCQVFGSDARSVSLYFSSSNNSFLASPSTLPHGVIGAQRQLSK